MSSHKIADERGLIEVLYTDGSDPSKGFFFPNAKGSGEMLSLPKALLRPAIEQLLAHGSLVPIESNERLRVYKLHDHTPTNP